MNAPCDQCGKLHKRKPYRMSDEHRYCSQHCRWESVRQGKVKHKAKYNYNPHPVIDRPIKNRCCTCGVRVENPYTEVRPSGKGGRDQTWCYCVPCWWVMLGLREEAQVEVS